METITIIGTLAAIFTTIANIPQAYKIIKDKTSKGVSAGTYLVLLIGTSLWTAYGILKSDLPLIITNSISSLLSIVILILHQIPDRKIKKVNKVLSNSGSKK
ncbi:SemiSWEET transporter [Flavobacterium lindanitolerans]|uniref:SemiSWEET family sugar transporter n=1 Tax=Flavobacterium lindanitolerans TaxID=428988 RepID=UPI0031DCB191